MKKPGEQGIWRDSDSLPGKQVLVEGAGSGRTEVQLELFRRGRDYLLTIGGGDVHVGAVAVAWEGDSEILVVPGHKEGPLAERCAREVARVSGCTCAAVGGIHQDNATREEIEAIVANVEQALRRLLTRAFSVNEEGRDDDGRP